MREDPVKFLILLFFVPTVPIALVWGFGRFLEWWAAP